MNMRTFLLLCTFVFVLYFCINSREVEAARILAVFPVRAKSHFTFDRTVLDNLVAAGHEVTLITSFPKDVSEEDYTIIDASKSDFVYVSKLTVQTNKSTYGLLDSILNFEEKYCDKVLHLPEVQDILNSEEKLFDLVFLELFVTYKCFYYFVEKLQVPFIGTVSLRSSSYADSEIGNPYFLSYIPYELGHTAEYASFLKPFKNVWDSLIGRYFWHTRLEPFLTDFYTRNANMLRKYSHYSDIRPSLVFYNSHASFLPRPMNPNAIEIAGIHIPKEKPLPKNVQKFIDEARHGVILFTFGSALRADTMTSKVRTAFSEAFARIPQRVIWKFESKIEDLPDNVLVSEWVPQRDILAHKNVIAFLTHGGIAGLYEAIHCGKPIISVPLFGDQSSNTAILEELGVAIRLNIDAMSTEDILNALNDIANETRYHENMQKLSKAFKDRPITPQQAVVYWTEYVLRHNGTAYLQSASVKLNWFKYLLLDVVFNTTLCLIILCYVLYSLIKRLFRLRSKKSIDQSKKLS